MTTDHPFEPALRPEYQLRPLGPIASVLPEDDAGAPYDGHAAFYDRLIGNRLYNRLLWGTNPAVYREFAAEVVAAGDGPLLDAGCGTALFTAAAYRSTARPVVLLDRSAGMLECAAARLGDAPATLIQGDLLALPFASGQFQTVACHAMLHVLDDPSAALDQLAAQVAPGGRCFASMLVADRGGLSSPYLRMLQRRGEVGAIWQTDDLATAAEASFGKAVRVTRTGSMAWLRTGPLRADA